MKPIYIVLWIFLLVGASGCNYLDIKPAGQVMPESVSDYRAMLVKGYSVFPEYKFMLTLRSDEAFPNGQREVYDYLIDLAVWNDGNASEITKSYPWLRMYNVIFYANSVIENVMDASLDTKTDTREQLMGEAFLLRAYAHFELLNLYGQPYKAATAASDQGVPLSLKIDIEQYYVPSTVEEVYQQVLKDLEEGMRWLEVEEQTDPTLRYRFSKRSAKALEARIRLYRAEWEKALEAAEALLPCELENLNDAEALSPENYKSKEMILALDKVIDQDLLGGNTYMLPEIMEKYRKDGDKRVDLFFEKEGDKYLPNKMGDTKVTFRSAEIYLIAAEAAAHLEGKTDIAKGYLKQLMANRLTPEYYQQKAAEVEAMNVTQLIAEIADERARELVFEGHRWYDLRRTTRPQIVKNYTDKNGDRQTATLQADDPRYTIRFPREAIEHNPDLNH